MVKKTSPRCRREPLETSSLSSMKQGSIDSPEVLSDILVLPEAKVSKKRRREPACAKCLTNDSVLEEMKSKVKDKEEEKRAKAVEREEKRWQKELKLEREQQNNGQKQEKSDVERKKKRRGNESRDDLVLNLKL